MQRHFDAFTIDESCIRSLNKSGKKYCRPIMYNSGVQVLFLFFLTIPKIYGVTWQDN